MFKSEDEKRQEAATKAGKACNRCGGTGTIGIGQRGAIGASPCPDCGGSGMKR